jgi:hypothetical protein
MNDAQFNPLKPSGNYIYHRLLQTKKPTVFVYGFVTIISANRDYFLTQR